MLLKLVDEAVEVVLCRDIIEFLEIIRSVDDEGGECKRQGCCFIWGRFSIISVQRFDLGLQDCVPQFLSNNGLASTAFPSHTSPTVLQIPP